MAEDAAPELHIYHDNKLNANGGVRDLTILCTSRLGIGDISIAAAEDAANATDDDKNVCGLRTETAVCMLAIVRRDSSSKKLEFGRPVNASPVVGSWSSLTVCHTRQIDGYCQ
jgi:hypothetical protein